MNSLREKLLVLPFLSAGSVDEKTYKMVFVPASEKGDESDYTSLIAITEKLTGFNIDTILDLSFVVSSFRSAAYLIPLL